MLKLSASRRCVRSLPHTSSPLNAHLYGVYRRQGLPQTHICASFAVFKLSASRRFVRRLPYTRSTLDAHLYGICSVQALHWTTRASVTIRKAYNKRTHNMHAVYRTQELHRTHICTAFTVHKLSTTPCVRHLPYTSYHEAHDASLPQSSPALGCHCSCRR